MEPGEVGKTVLFAALPGLSLEIKFRSIDMKTEQLLLTGMLLTILAMWCIYTLSPLKILGISVTS